MARRRCSVAPTGVAVSGGAASSNTNVPRISAAPRYARTGVRRCNAGCASGSARKRTLQRGVGREGGVAEHRAAPQLADLDARQVDRDARAGADDVARRSEHVQRPDAHVASGRIEPQRVAGVQRPLHQRTGDDRAVSGQREDAVDRQKRRRAGRARRQRRERRADRAA